MGKNLYTATQFINAIPGSGGIVSTIAKRLGCDWNTARKYIDTMPTVKAAYDAECERVLDMAEGTIMKAIESGDTQDAKWYLSKKGKGRGYGDAVDVTSGGERIEAVIDARSIIDRRLAGLGRQGGAAVDSEQSDG